MVFREFDEKISFSETLTQQLQLNQADFSGDGELAKWVVDETPAGRWALPEEVASLTLFVASKAADYIHAQLFRLMVVR